MNATARTYGARRRSWARPSRHAREPGFSDVFFDARGDAAMRADFFREKFSFGSVNFVGALSDARRAIFLRDGTVLVSRCDDVRASAALRREFIFDCGMTVASRCARRRCGVVAAMPRACGVRCRYASARRAGRFGRSVGRGSWAVGRGSAGRRSRARAAGPSVATGPQAPGRVGARGGMRRSAARAPGGAQQRERECRAGAFRQSTRSGPSCRSWPDRPGFQSSY